MEKALEALRSPMMRFYVLKTAEKLAEERGEPVSLETVLRSRTAMEYARELGISERLRRALDYL